MTDILDAKEKKIGKKNTHLIFYFKVFIKKKKIDINCIFPFVRKLDF